MSNFNLFDVVVITGTFNFGAPFLEFILDVDLELLALVEHACFIVIDFFPMFVLTLGQVKFNSIVACSDSLDVPIDVLSKLDCPDVIKKHYDVQENEHNDTSNSQTKYLSLLCFGFLDFARKLDEDECIITTLIFVCLVLE